MNTKLITAGLAAILAAAAVGAPAQSKITKITSKSVGGGVEIAIQGESLKAPKAFFIKGGTSYVVEFKAKLATKQARFTVRRAGVAYYNYAQYRVSPPIARLHVRVDKGIKPKLSNEDGTWFVRINVKHKKQYFFHVAPIVATVHAGLGLGFLTGFVTRVGKARRESVPRYGSKLT